MEKNQQLPVAQQNRTWAESYKGELVEVECYNSLPVCGGIPHHHRALVPPDVAKKYGKKMKVLGPYKRPETKKPREEGSGQGQGHGQKQGQGKLKEQDAQVMKDLEPVLKAITDENTAKVVLDAEAIPDTSILVLARAYGLKTEDEPAKVREAVHQHVCSRLGPKK